jgi:hypothetical protein
VPAGTIAFHSFLSVQGKSIENHFISWIMNIPFEFEAHPSSNGSLQAIDFYLESLLIRSPKLKERYVFVSCQFMSDLCTPDAEIDFVKVQTQILFLKNMTVKGLCCKNK